MANKVTLNEQFYMDFCDGEIKETVLDEVVLDVELIEEEARVKANQAIKDLRK